MTNLGKKAIYLPVTKRRKYVSPLTKKMVKSIPTFIILGLSLLCGYLLRLVFLANQPDELISPIKGVEAHEFIQPTPTPEYLPSKKTRALINANPGFSGKLKEMYGSQWRYAAELIARESGFNPGIFNPTSGACGLGQFLPCSKLKCELTDIDCQLRAIDDYVADRYKTFKGAIAFHDFKKQECLDKQARGEISQNKVCAGWY